MCKFLLVCPKGHEKVFFKLFKKAGLLQKEEDLQSVNIHIPAEKVSAKRRALKALGVIYVGVEAKNLERYQAHVLAGKQPEEEVFQLATDCIQPGLKPVGADKVIMCNSNDSMISHLQQLVA